MYVAKYIIMFTIKVGFPLVSNGSNKTTIQDPGNATEVNTTTMTLFSSGNLAISSMKKLNSNNNDLYQQKVGGAGYE